MSLKKLEMLMMVRKIYMNNKGDKETKMNKLIKLGMFIAIAAYVISPADMMGGPLDDIILMILGAVANKKLNKKEDKYMKGKNIVEANGYDVY